MENKNIIAKVDGHIIETNINIFVESIKIIDHELKNRGLHFDDSPFGCILNLCDTSELDEVLSTDLEKHYWTKKILTGKTINRKFDIVNYIKQSFVKMTRQQAHAWVTTRERLEQERAFKSMWNTFS